MESNDRVILALDGLSCEDALHLTEQIGQDVYAMKIHNLWDERGPRIVSELKDVGARRVWVDLKLYDIPKTVGLRACAVRHAGADILTVAADCGREAMKVAVQNGPAEIFAVTVLTSLDDAEIRRHCGERTLSHLVVSRAEVASEAGVQGIVCSPQELVLLKCDPRFLHTKLVTPGVRSAGVSAHDQKRTATPAEAVRRGAAHIVVGRQVTQAVDRYAALEQLLEELS